MRILPLLWRLRKFGRHFFYLAIVGTICGQLRAQNLPLLAVAAPAPPKSPAFNLKADAPGRIEFEGSQSAVLFSKEIEESFEGTLERDYVSDANDKFPAGFLNASPPGNPGTAPCGRAMQARS